MNEIAKSNENDAIAYGERKAYRIDERLKRARHATTINKRIFNAGQKVNAVKNARVGKNIRKNEFSNTLRLGIIREKDLQ